MKKKKILDRILNPCFLNRKTEVLTVNENKNIVRNKKKQKEVI